jgi:arginase
VTRIFVPYHLDEYLPDLDSPLAPDVTITADLPDGDAWHRMAHLYRSVAETVAGAVGHGERPSVVSGDCSTSLATVAGLQRAGLEPAIVWLDAHGDVQTLETSASGYLGGMPVRILVGYRPELIAAPLGLRPVPEERVVLVDARDLDPPEVEYLARAAIRRYDVDELSADNLPDGPIYLHLDADVIDSAELPGLLFPVPGGPSASRVGEALRRVFDTGRVVAFGAACTWRAGTDTSAGTDNHAANNHGDDNTARVRRHLEPLVAAWETT